MSTYFIKSGQWVKIGKSKNPVRRFLSFCGASPTPLVLMKVSDDVSEKEAHEFAQSKSKRGSGEWFELNEEIEKWIESITSAKSEDSIKSRISYAFIGVGHHLRPKKQRVSVSSTKRATGRPKGVSKRILSVTVDIEVLAKLKELKVVSKRTLSSIVDELLAAALKPKKKEAA